MSAAIPGGRSEIERLIETWRKRARANDGANYVANQVAAVVRTCADELDKLSALLTAAGSAPVTTLAKDEQILLDEYRQNKCGDPHCESLRQTAARIVLRGTDTHLWAANLVHAAVKAECDRGIQALTDAGAAVPAQAPAPEIEDAFKAGFDAHIRGHRGTKGCALAFAEYVKTNQVPDAARPSRPPQEQADGENRRDGQGGSGGASTVADDAGATSGRDAGDRAGDRRAEHAAQVAAALPGRAQASPELLELGAPASAIERICVENEEADEGRIWCRVCEKDDVTDMHAPECPIGKLRELLASADAAVQEPNPWRSIETAPVGMIVLVHDDGDVSKALMMPDGQWLDVECGRDDAFYDPPPQHWMPLPAAPLPATEPTK